VPFNDAKDNYGWAMLRLNGVELMLNNAYEDNIRPAGPDAPRVALIETLRSTSRAATLMRPMLS
jgi:hypothetical protein